MEGKYDRRRNRKRYKEAQKINETKIAEDKQKKMQGRMQLEKKQKKNIRRKGQKKKQKRGSKRNRK